MPVLLTGGTGYIGSHTAAALLRAGESVVIADNLSNSRRETVDALEALTGVRPAFCEIDVCDRAALARVFREHEIEAVIHFAGYKAVGESVMKPLAYYRNNLDAAVTVLECMREAGCRRFVFSSSATVYGTDNPPPYREDMEPGRCTSPYGWTKAMIERILTDEAAADGSFSAALLRYFNPIGADESGLIGEEPQGIPNNLMPYITETAAGVREKLRIFGTDYPTEDGTCVRDFIHVTDLAEGHRAALAYTETHTGAEAFNLGTGRGCSVKEVVETFERVNGLVLPKEAAPRRSGDLSAFWADPSKAEKTLGWKAEKTLEDMCRDAWRYERNRRNA